MTPKMALATASLVWDDSWLDTMAAQELIATLWDADPRGDGGESVGSCQLHRKDRSST